MCLSLVSDSRMYSARCLGPTTRAAWCNTLHERSRSASDTMPVKSKLSSEHRQYQLHCTSQTTCQHMTGPIFTVLSTIKRLDAESSKLDKQAVFGEITQAGLLHHYLPLPDTSAPNPWGAWGHDQGIPYQLQKETAHWSVLPPASVYQAAIGATSRTPSTTAVPSTSPFPAPPSMLLRC